MDVEATPAPPPRAPNCTLRRIPSGFERETVCCQTLVRRPLGKGGSGAMARGGQRTASRQSLTDFLLRCNLSPEAQKVVVFVIMMLLVIINVVLMFLLAFQ